MNVLIVDDDKTMIDMLLDKIDWQRLKITETCYAYSSTGAKKIIENQKIDLILCDIEMPGESGLEFLDWLRKRHSHTICIFITNHLEFNYAQNAIQLNAFDYISKLAPVEQIQSTIARAVQSIETQENTVAYEKKSFFRDLVFFDVYDNEDYLQHVLTAKQLPYQLHYQFTPIAFVFTHYELIDHMDEYRIFVINNVLSGLFFKKPDSHYLINYALNYKNVFLLFVNHYTSPHISRKEDLKATIENAYSFFQDSMNLVPTIYADTTQILMTSFYKWNKQLQFLDNANITNRDKIIYGLENPDEKINTNQNAIHFPEDWEELLAENKLDKLLTQFKEFMYHSSNSSKLTKNTLQGLKYDLLQIIFKVTNKNKIPAHAIFFDENTLLLEQNASSSVTAFIKWVTKLLFITSSAIKESANNDSLSNQMAHYIETNYFNHIGREDIADAVHLTPTYAGKLFKQDMGLSINNYLAKVRIDHAKQLLRNSSYNISEITFMVGFEHFTYFSSTFKNLTGMTPKEYRQQLQQ